MLNAASPAHPDPAWRGRVTAALVAALLLWPMLVATEFKPWLLFDESSLRATGRFLSGFLVPAHTPEFLALLLQSAWETVALATAGMALALLGAIPLSLLATSSLSVARLESGRMHPAGALMRQAARWWLVLLRSVPELVWALLFVRIAGIGPTAGLLAIALTYCGMLGKVYAEILESGEAHAMHALMRNGSGRLAALCYGALPAAAPEFVSYTAYRWECAIRGSVVMGFVGAGGIGQRMDESMKMLAGDEVASMLIVLVLLVGCADLVSAFLRRSLG